VGLADPGRADETEAFLRVPAARKILGEARRTPDGRDQFFVRVGDEGVELARAIARRNARVLEQTRRRALTPAVAADDAADSIDRNGLPPGVVAALAHVKTPAILAPIAVVIPSFSACSRRHLTLTSALFSFETGSASITGCEARTSSAGEDLTSAVLSRCSQSPSPRASSCFTYSMNWLTSPCICSILRRMLRMISTPARFTPRSRVSERMVSSCSRSSSE